MKEQERLRNRQADLERMRNKHAKSQFDMHPPISNNASKNNHHPKVTINRQHGQEEYFADEDSNENSEDYYQNLYQSNGENKNFLSPQNQPKHNSKVNQAHNGTSDGSKNHVNIVDDYDEDDYYYTNNEQSEFRNDDQK